DGPQGGRRGGGRRDGGVAAGEWPGADPGDRLMAAPLLRFSFGFGSTWRTESVDWTEVDVADVRDSTSLTVNRGRSSELDDDRAGRCSFTLMQRDRRYDPTYVDGPHYGHLVPGVPVKVEAKVASTWFPIFTGTVEGWPQDWEQGVLGLVQVRAVDGFEKLATAGMPSSVYAWEVAQDSPVAWYRLAES